MNPPLYPTNTDLPQYWAATAIQEPEANAERAEKAARIVLDAIVNAMPKMPLTQIGTGSPLRDFGLQEPGQLELFLDDVFLPLGVQRLNSALFYVPESTFGDVVREAYARMK